MLLWAGRQPIPAPDNSKDERVPVAAIQHVQIMLFRRLTGATTRDSFFVSPRLPHMIHFQQSRAAHRVTSSSPAIDLQSSWREGRD